MSKPCIIIVDDDPTITDYVTEVSLELGFHAIQATSGKEFFTLVSENTPNAIVLDVVMPDMDGLEVIEQLANRNISTSIILMSGYQEQYLDIAESLARARGLNVIGTLRKPFTPSELSAMLNTTTA